MRLCCKQLTPVSLFLHSTLLFPEQYQYWFLSTEPCVSSEYCPGWPKQTNKLKKNSLYSWNISFVFSCENTCKHVVGVNRMSRINHWLWWLALTCASKNSHQDIQTKPNYLSQTQGILAFPGTISTSLLERFWIRELNVRILTKIL